MKNQQMKNASNQIMTNPEIFFINKETGETAQLSGVASVSFLSEEDKAPVNICNSYNFECNLKIDSFDKEFKKLLYEDSTWKMARRLCDELNDLIEEYHAPGTPRRERRAIKRHFNKIFRIFHNHCKEYNMLYSFKRPNK
jgi:tRNA-dihydrouridine synthase